MSLPTYRRIFADLVSADGLLVLARGCGLRILLAKFAKIHCAGSGTVCILGLDAMEGAALVDMVAADGIPDDRLPFVVDADTGAPARQRLYARGGCLIITSRIIIVDMLAGRVAGGPLKPTAPQIAGFLVANAHHVTETSTEAFILRLYRERGGTGFIKAFSDDPETLASGFNRVENTLRALRVPKLYLWPRFHVLLARDLDAARPQVEELSTPLTPLQVTVQRAILECMDGCLAQIRATTHVDVDELTLENGLFEEFDTMLRLQLGRSLPSLPARTRAALDDLHTLRKLLGYLGRYDAVTFCQLLDSIRASALAAANATGGGAPSEWVTTAAGARLFNAAKARIYTCVVDDSNVDSDSRHSVVHHIGARRMSRSAGATSDPLSKRRRSGESDGADVRAVTITHSDASTADGGNVRDCIDGSSDPFLQYALPKDLEDLVVIVRGGNTEKTVTAAEPPSRRGGSSAARPHVATASLQHVRMRVVLERNPKWLLMQDVLHEIVTESTAGPEGFGAGCVVDGGARVLIVARDERAAAQLRDILTDSAARANSGTCDAMRVAGRTVAAGGPGAAMLATAFERHSHRHYLRTRGLRDAVLASGHLVAAPDSVLPLLLHLSELPRRERELILAAEMPGWPDANTAAAVGVSAETLSSGAASRTLTSLLARRYGGNTDDDAVPNASSFQDALADSLRSAEVDASVVAVVRKPDAGADEPTSATHPNSTGVTSAPRPAPDARPVPAPETPSIRPYVSAETRLLWKVAALFLRAEREATMERHVLIAAGCNDTSRNDDLDREFGDAEDIGGFTFVRSDDDIDLTVAQRDLGGVGNNAVTGSATHDTSVSTVDPQAALPRKRQTLTAAEVVLIDDDAGAGTHEQQYELLHRPHGTNNEKAAATDIKTTLLSLASAPRKQSKAMPVTAGGPRGRGSMRAGRAAPRGAGRGGATAGARLTATALALDWEQQKRQHQQAEPLAALLPQSVSLLPRVHVVIFPLIRIDERGGAALLLSADLRPDVIVCYDADPTFTREVEVYAATRHATAPPTSPTSDIASASSPLRVFFLVASQSAEEQRYLSALRKERAAFEKLIAAKSHMAPPTLGVRDAAAAAEATGPVVIRKGAPDGWGIRFEDSRSEFLAAHARDGGVAGALSMLTGGASVAAGTSLGALTVDIGTADLGRRRVIVDLREFRARLPSRLNAVGLEIVPLTLDVGDYVLSPDMVVERKSRSDLIGSLNSGRLYTQAEAMVRAYRNPLLVIEFDEDTPFTLLGGPVDATVELTSPLSKLVLLLLHFQTLRVLWCRTPAATAIAFAALKQNQEEPDVEAAAMIASDGVTRTASCAASEANDAAESNTAALEMLRKLPGVTAATARALQARIRCLADIAEISELELGRILGAGNAALLHRFLHANDGVSIE